MRGRPLGALIPAPPLPCVLGTRCVSQVGWEKAQRGGQSAAGCVEGENGERRFGLEAVRSSLRGRWDFALRAFLQAL